MNDIVRMALAGALATLSLGFAGCGIDRGGAPVVVAFTPQPDASTDAVAGPISSKSGSTVVIGGTTLDVRNALIQINGMAADLSQLEPGHYAVVEADFTDAASAVARNVSVSFEAIGPIDAVQGDVLGVLGQSVVIGDGTLLDPSLDGLDLADDSQVPAVAVSGFADGSGAILATRLSLDTSGVLRLTGFASDVVAGVSALSIGAQSIDYSSASVIATSVSALAEGGRVTVTLSGAAPAADLPAQTLIDAPIVPASLTAGASVRIVGLVTTFSGGGDFSVAFTPAALTDGATVVGGSAADLALGRLVIASGTLTADRSLRVSTLEYLD